MLPFFILLSPFCGDFPLSGKLYLSHKKVKELNRMYKRFSLWAMAALILALALTLLPAASAGSGQETERCV